VRRVAIPPFTAAPVRPAGARLLHLQGATMGTTWRARIAAAAGVARRTLEAAAVAEMDAVIDEMSNWSPTSALSRFNDAEAGTVHDLPPRFAAVLDAALAVAAETDGAFDPTVGALVDLWGFGPRAVKGAPAAAAIDAARDLSGWARLRRDGDRLIQPGGVRLDLSGIAKGYAADRVAARLAAAGAQAALVEIGGELTGFGVKPDGSPWWVAVEDIVAAWPSTLVALCDCAIATSGDTRRFRDLDGGRVAHTIDPRSGRPADNGVAAVSVVAAACMQADAYATAIAVMGPEQGLAFAAARGIAARIAMRTSRGAMVEILSPAFAAMLD
jgi:thiamine biosynthesis lipoprotein